MPQHDLDIANQSAPNFRADLNNALEALGTLSSGSTAPATTYANQLWYDTGNNILKMRTEADDGWIELFDFDQGGGLAKPSTPDVLDEDDFASNSATRPPSQQSTKAYVDAGPRIKAWVNFNGEGTVSIRESFNVSSITDNGTGDYTVNFTTAMPDASYATTGSAQSISGSFHRFSLPNGGVYTASQVQVVSNVGEFGLRDSPIFSVIVAR